MSAEPSDSLDRLTAEAGAVEAVRRIGHEAWLRRRAEESAQLVGVLIDLAERRAPVGVSLVSGATRNGVIVMVGSDMIGVRLHDGRRAFIAADAIATVAPDPGVPDVVGDRVVDDLPERPDLHSAIGDLVDEQPLVEVHPVGADQPVTGRLERLGLDVLAVRSTGQTGQTGPVTHVPLGAVVEVLVASP